MTLADVAAAAGVSTSTVSRYVRGQLSVQAVTASRIDAALNHTGYKAPLIASDTTTVGLIVPELRNPYYSDLADELSTQAAASGLTLIMSVSGSTPVRESLAARHMGAISGLAGIVYLGMNRHNDELAQLVRRRVPIVVVDEDVDTAADTISTVTVDNFGGAYQATNYLIAQGHSRIAHIGGPRGVPTAEARLGGFRAALADHGIDALDDYIIRGAYSDQFGANVFRHLAGTGSMPTAVFAASDVVAFGMIGAAERHGIRIPDDMSIIGCDGVPMGQWLTPQLTTVAQPISEIARTAIRAFSDLREREISRREVLPMQLRVGASVRQLAQEH
ncbi:LacI family DNA-binding transcriptional regulator [Spelaeicoccus albus]|uniref:LacI family transcriptional regulator/LacI family repressor for deo operon, udp, cdd, tsx, nupC, and nupG n=2 Tax=Spelaeicoccus albus TaxID=1280376 RepID=A0A7Z0D4N9_9MICO|nr:LacI family DNA-binding transcriptional regulator [Spelaeicoccus albus]NYI68799.1 LacI family transcriptional regulator/LacI family repressor for deo operon, udp, cdd, tsx, nupC, and nupG [Spelaeicoccus albus]